MKDEEVVTSFIKFSLLRFNSYKDHQIHADFSVFFLYFFILFNGILTKNTKKENKKNTN